MKILNKKTYSEAIDFIRGAIAAVLAIGIFLMIIYLFGFRGAIAAVLTIGIFLMIIYLFG